MSQGHIWNCILCNPPAYPNVVNAWLYIANKRIRSDLSTNNDACCKLWNFASHPVYILPILINNVNLNIRRYNMCRTNTLSATCNSCCACKHVWTVKYEIKNLHSTSTTSWNVSHSSSRWLYVSFSSVINHIQHCKFPATNPLLGIEPIFLRGNAVLISRLQGGQYIS